MSELRSNEETWMDEQMVLLTERCTERNCGRVRHSELTDDANTHWHSKRGVALVPVSELAEVTRLRTENERLQEAWDGTDAAFSAANRQVSQLRAKIERVEKIAGNWRDRSVRLRESGPGERTARAAIAYRDCADALAVALAEDS